MIIKILIILAKRIKRFDEWIKKFIEIYTINTRPISTTTLTPKELAEQSMTLINKYEKLGKASGLPAPRVCKQPLK